MGPGGEEKDDTITHKAENLATEMDRETDNATDKQATDLAQKGKRDFENSECATVK